METFKINYKSDFVLRLASDAGWGTAFTLEFWSNGAPTKRYYATHDGNGNYTNCKPDSDTELRVMFDDHGLGIGNLMLRITYSLADEEFRTGKDDEVVNVVAITVLNDEGEEVNVVLNLEGETAAEVQYSLPLLEAERKRQNAEAQRIAAEQQRQLAETLRKQAELDRQASEDVRKSNESTREAAEQQRQTAEAARAAEFKTNEAARKETFETNEAERQATFEANEAERQVLYEKVAKNTDGIELLNTNTGVSEYPTFDEAKAYAVGDVVLYEGLLKRFTSAHEAGAWDGSQVEAWSERKNNAGIRSEISNLNILSTEGVALQNLLSIPVEVAGNGYIIEKGTPTYSSSFFYTDFIQVDESCVYRVNVVKAQFNSAVGFYKEASFDSFVTVGINDKEARLVNDIVSVPAEAKYMVVFSNSQSVLNVSSYEKARSASLSVESLVDTLQYQLDNGALSNLLSNTDNIFNACSDYLVGKQLYVKSDGTMVDNAVTKATVYFIFIGQTTEDKFYNFKVFSSSYDNLYKLCIGYADAIEVDKVYTSGICNRTKMRGYVKATVVSNLYMEVVFKDNTPYNDVKETIKNIARNIVVTESDLQTYPTEYVPYKRLGFSAKADITEGEYADVYIVDSANQLVGNKVRIPISAGQSGGSSQVIDNAYLNSVKTITLNTDENVVAEAVLGDGWSGDLTNGYTHESGKTAPLEFELSQFINGDKFLLEFNCAGITSESSDLNICVGDTPTVKTYNGGTVFKLGFVANGGNLIITPASNFDSTITDISIRKINEDGKNAVTLNVDNVYAQINSMTTAFWNVAIGAKNNTLNSLINGSRNVAIGNYALKDLPSGNRNIAIGTFAMPFLTEAENNVAIGADTIYPLIKAFNCVGIGKGTLGGNQTAEDCIAVGTGAMGVWNLQSNRQKCVAIGVNSGSSIVDSCTHVGHRAGANVAGARNTSIGYNSLAVGNRQTVDITGTDLTCVGSMAQIANTDEAKAATNSTAIGANTTITKSNQVIIGNSQVEEIQLGGKKIIFNSDGTVIWEEVTQ